MKIAQIQFAPWDKIYFFDANDFQLSKGNKVIVKTNLGMEIGEVAGVFDTEKKPGCKCPKKEECQHNQIVEKDIKPILRMATPIDFEKIPSPEEKDKAMSYCKKLAKKYELPMKLVDIHFSFDGSRITFAFIADSRVDFRELVKELTRYFNRTIRLQQIGIRDEAKMTGDFGHCGKPLCCRSFLQDLTSITSEMADMQQCAHRGSERISGLCGRLMCCLAYEQTGYEELNKKMPPIGARVSVDGQKGEVVGHHVLKQTVDVKFPGEKGEQSTISEVNLNRNK